MDRLDLNNQILNPEFDYLTLCEALKQYKSPRDQITKLLREKTIVRVKKGLYVLGHDFGRPFSIYVLANLVYGPSYVSLQTALSFYGAIPEKVQEIQSTTLNRKKIFNTPIGRFSYVFLSSIKYQVSVCRQKIDKNRYFFIASPEKALVELLEKETAIQSPDDLSDWLSSQRIEDEFLKHLNHRELKKMKDHFSEEKIKWLLKIL